MKVFLDASFLIYLNTMTSVDRKELDDLFRKLLEESLFTNLLVIDETLYISERKFGFPYDLTLDFIKRIVLPYAEIIPIEEENLKIFEKYLLTYTMKPSDAIHLATMEKADVNYIVTEDEDFDKVKEVKRVWLSAR